MPTKPPVPFDPLREVARLLGHDKPTQVVVVADGSPLVWFVEVWETRPQRLVSYAFAAARGGVLPVNRVVPALAGVRADEPYRAVNVLLGNLRKVPWGRPTAR